MYNITVMYLHTFVEFETPAFFQIQNDKCERARTDAGCLLIKDDRGQLHADNDPDALVHYHKNITPPPMSLEAASQKWTQELNQTATELNKVSHELELKFAAKKSSSGKYVPPVWFSRTSRHCIVEHFRHM
jgi:hypothetical protein